MAEFRAGRRTCAWAGSPLRARQLAEPKGPALQPTAPQSELAEELLDQFRALVADPAYVERISRHYELLRERVARPRRKSRVRSPRRRKKGG